MIDLPLFEDPVMTWWSLLSATALLNLVAWTASAALLQRRRSESHPSIARTRQLVLWLSAVYVVGCAFRSLLPMIDAARICLHDTPVSRIIIGRSVATLAELCFAAQFALLLREAATASGQRAIGLVARVLFPLAVIAEPGDACFRIRDTSARDRSGRDRGPVQRGSQLGHVAAGGAVALALLQCRSLDKHRARTRAPAHRPAPATGR